MPPFEHPRIAAILQRDSRYSGEAYYFIYEAVEYTQQSLLAASESPAAVRHITGRQLCEGVRDYARDQFGLLANTVFRIWGIHQTADIGEIVFHLIDQQFLSKTESDRREDFWDLFDLPRALSDDYPMSMAEFSRSRRGER
ncbi:Minf_1886 family protein [Tuwongella immobilis]|uniref:Marine sediment metagenome DNA, contig: S01H1_S26776 n=1 Tax=Tuwongella immobilis TaxID=692036 RepID=A0A6C2YLN8_9BACT|nr:Minf_1886 family protein [Tuwongella immobilis]VIP02490.1 Marine sediment metagenome DNA, contig: S01H1_S26776 OS=marine sediment metagenome GN=S01H1_63176 PE=4 SV=1 [Tuwongella immobilis]VTS01557.1 Marine sediment metagenome DNA, contig: S01H1_S26776 OS=marine sediment metagenome GN=S01H1_63176 PE=4 SV=1 [Tuwongella immobilis]